MDLLTDLRHALRGLVARPGFTLVVILTLGLGIGATTTVYSFAFALLLRPYPYQDPDRLVQVQSVYTKEGGARRGASLLDIEDYRRRSQGLANIGAYTVFDTRLLTDGPPQVVSMSQINAQALSLLGVQPILGRLLLEEEDRPGGDLYKAVIAHAVWQTHFGSDPAIVGKPLRTDRQTYTIVGVMPPGFGFPNRVGVWTPMESWYQSLPPGDDRREKWRGGRWYTTIARVRPDTTVAQAESDVNSVAAALEQEYPKENDGVRVALTPLREFEMGKLRPYLLACLGGVAFVLLICCANVANLLLVRTTARQRDIAVQVALGAGNERIARGLLLESFALGIGGAMLGVLLAWVGVAGLLALIPVPLPAWLRIEVDAPVLAFSIVIGLVTALLFGLAPMLAARRVDLNSSLRNGARGSARSKVRTTLVVAEVALSVMLLVGAGLLMKTFLRLQTRDPGFSSDGVVAARAVLWAAGNRQTSAATLGNIHTRVIDALGTLPGVRSVAVTNSLPYSGTSTERLQADIFIRGRSEDETQTLASITGADVGPSYFATMRIPLVRGRLFEATDTTEAEPVIVISERAARLFWPNEDPLGRYISWGKPTEGNPWTRVIGIVGNVKQHAAEGDVGVEFYYPVAQWPVSNSYYLVRTTGDPDVMLDVVRRSILETEPTIAVSSVKTVERTMTESLWQRRLWGVLFTAFAVLAVLLAAVGVYGVLSYAVSQRTREMGVRMALGAAPGRVRSLIVREGMRLCLGGALIGLAGAFALGRLGSSLLFEVRPYDGSTYGLVVLVVVGIGLLACWLPALRASRVDPLLALRQE